MKPFKIKICQSVNEVLSAGRPISELLLKNNEHFIFEISPHARYSYASTHQDDYACYIEAYSHPNHTSVIPEAKLISLARLNELDCAFIANRHFKTPDFCFIGKPADIITYLDPNKRYVAKGFGGARGHNKFHFNPRDINNMSAMLDYSCGETLMNENITQPHEVVTGEVTAEDADSHICFNGSFIMEDIGFENIEEYRLILLKTGHFILEKRSGYHPLSSFERKHEEIDYIPESLAFDIDEILTSCQKILIDSNYPFASFDLYVRTDKNDFSERYGLFEYCVQFGIYYTLPILKQLQEAYSMSLGLFCLEKLGLEHSIKHATSNSKQIKVRN